MKLTYYTTFTITYLTPISNESGDDIFYETYSFDTSEGFPETKVEEMLTDLHTNGAVIVGTTEGLLYLNNHNIASIMVHKEED